MTTTINERYTSISETETVAESCCDIDEMGVVDDKNQSAFDLIVEEFESLTVQLNY